MNLLTQSFIANSIQSKKSSIKQKNPSTKPNKPSNLSGIIISSILMFFTILCSFSAYSSNMYAMANGDWDDVSCWSTTGPSGPGCGFIPLAGDDVFIDGFAIDFDLNTVDITINSLTISNASGGTSQFNISDGRILTVTNDVNVIMAGNINKSVSLMLTTNSVPKLLIGGDLIFTREITNVRNRALILDISGDGEVIVDGDYLYNYHNSAGHATDAIYMDSYGVLEIKGDFTANIFATATNGDYNITVGGKASLTVGSLASPKTLLINQVGGLETNLTIAGGATDPNFNIFGNAIFRTSSANDLDIFVSNDGAFYISDSLILEQTGAGVIDINIPGSGAYIDTRELIFDATGTGKIDISLSNSSAYFNLRGNVLQTNNFGRFNSTNGTFIYNGDVFQTFVPNGTGVDAWAYHDLRIDNSYNTYPQIVMGGEGTFTGDITFVDGIIRTNSIDLLIQDVNNGSAFGASDASYVDGPYKKIGTSPFTFPVGKNQFYRPIGIGQPDINGDAFLAEYFYADPVPVFGGNLSTAILPFDHISRIEYWTLDRSAGTADVEVVLSWNGYSGVMDYAELVVARFDVPGDEWVNEGSRNLTGNNSAGTITTADTVRTWTPFMGFTLGTASATNPLPIELLSFDATLEYKNVLLTWETASELNNDYFTVEKSIDGYAWIDIKQIRGAGTSNITNFYSTIDDNPYPGTNYYRLRQTDYDGKFTYSGIRLVELVVSENIEPVIFPNPGNGDLINIQYPFDVSKGEIKIIDITGKLIQSKAVYQLNQASIETVQLKENLAAGTYLIICNFDNKSFTNKFCLQ